MNPKSELKLLTDDWDKVAKLTRSLERYQELLAGKEYVSGDTAFVIGVALENIDPEFDIKEGSAITLRAIKEALSAAAKAAWRIIKLMWDFLNAMFIKFTGSIRRVRRNQEAVMKRVVKLGSKTSLERTMTVAGVQRLSIDGKFVGDELSALVDIKDITNYIMTIYPKSVTQIARNVSRKLLNILDDAADMSSKESAANIVDAFIDTYSTNFRAPPGATKLRKGETGDANPNFHRRGDILAGNSAFVYMAPEAISEALVNGSGDPSNLVSGSFKMSFTELSMNIADRSEREIDVPSVKELTTLLEEISRILIIAEKSDSSRKDFETVKTVVDDSIRQIMERTDSGEAVPAANLALIIIGEISKKLAEPMDNFTHWLAITMNVWVAFISHCVDHYESTGV